MGGENSKPLDRKEVAAKCDTKKPVNLLLTGGPSHGKTSLYNTCKFALTDERSTLRAYAGPGGTTGFRGTTSIHRYHLCGNVWVWDVPGLNFELQAARKLLKRILRGVNVPTAEFAITGDDIETSCNIADFMSSELEDNSDNAIDIPIWVVNPCLMERVHPGILGTSYCLSSPSANDDCKLLEAARKQSRWRLRPFVVFTYKDRCGLKLEDLQTYAFPWLAESNTLYIANYTKVNQQNNQTDQTALLLIAQILEFVSTVLEGREG